MPHPLLLAGCLVLLFAGIRLHLSVRLGAQRVELAWGETGLVLALAFVSAPWVVLLTPLAVFLCFADRRLPVVKTIYNVAIYTAAAAAAAGIVTLAGIARPIDGTDLLVLTAAGVVAGLVTYLAVAAVIAVVQDVSLLATWRASGGLQVLTLAGNLGVAAAVLILAREDPRLVAALPPVVLCLHQGYVGRFRGHEERKAGQRKSVAISQLTADLDEPAVVRRAAEAVATLTTADVVEVELPATSSAPASLYRHHRNADPWIGTPADAPPLPARLVAQVPIAGEGRAPVGELRVWLAAGTTDLRLSEWDKEAVGILAATTAAALGNARAHALQTHLATHDRLTGLPARPLLIERVEGPLRAGRGDGWKPVALLVVDVTGYREIVRTFGHDVAELLLARTARRLQASAEDQEYVAHIGGDDFGVYLPTAGDPAHVRSRALQLVAAVAQPIELDVGRVTLSATAGAAYSPTPVGSGTELLRQAAVALEQARAANIPVDFYDPATDELGSPAAVVLASELHAALDDDQLELHYQPVVHIPSGAPVAMETLTRWRHPTKGLLYPPDFMTVLEHSPDHARFVAWQLAQALHTRSHWGARDLPVTINLAARCLLDREFPAQVAAALKHAKVKGNQLMFEVAETATLTEEGLVGDVLTELRRLGVQVAVDALGTGNSSLINLLRVPATHVKIGAHFVQQMLVDEEAMSVVCLALDLGRRADLQVVAVGVGTEEHVTALLQLGCDTAQGWYLASPMPTDELRAYLDSAPAAAPQPKDVVVSLDTRRRITPS